MKRFLLLSVATLLCCLACKKSEIQTFKVEDCSVSFNGIENSFSLRGWTEEFKDLHVPVKVLGIPVDYDREITLDIRDSIAIIMSIVPNDYFRVGEPNYQKAIVKWTNSYARPVPDVWKNWYLYISTGYSKALHKILVAEYGDEIDFCVRQKSAVTPENGLIYKDPTWWSALNKRVREIVRDHDLLHPDDPYMHSDDYEDYPNSSTPVGQGRKPAVIPTIYSTLVSI